MAVRQLAVRIRKLRARARITEEFEHVITRRGTWSRDGIWYTSQKEHWLGWLAESGGPRYYGRKNSHRSADFIFNHIVCPPMVLWLAEASGVPKARLSKARMPGFQQVLSFRPKVPLYEKLFPGNDRGSPPKQSETIAEFGLQFVKTLQELKISRVGSE